MKFTLTSHIFGKQLKYQNFKRPDMKTLVLEPHRYYFEPFWEEIHPDNHEKHVEILVGGPLITLCSNDNTMTCYYAKNHMKRGLRRNDLGLMIITKLGFQNLPKILFGNLVFMGSKDQGGEDTGLKKDDIRLITNILDVYLKKNESLVI